MKKLLLFAILANMISCYTYVNDELPRIRAIKPKTKIETISFRITGIEDKNDLKNYNQIVKENFDKSGLFQAVNIIDPGDKLEKADKHHLEIHLKRQDVFENNWLFGASGWVSIMTFTVVPAFNKNKVSMLVDYYIDGKLKSYDRFYQSSTSLLGIIPFVLKVKNGDSEDKPDQVIVKNLSRNALFYLNELNFTETTK